MSLSGRYSKDAERNYKTVEGRALLAAVREFLRLIDSEMKVPQRYTRGWESKMARLANGLEIAADAYDLFGEKDRRRKRSSHDGA